VEFTRGPGRSQFPAPCKPAINHGGCAFIENKRYREEPRRIGDVVNQNAGFVYQTDAVLNLSRWRADALSGAPGETVQSTSMFKKLSLALLAGASLLGLGMQQAVAREPQAIFSTEPVVISADRPAPQPVEQRVAYAERPNLGGGFIEFLFGDGQQQSGRYQQQPYDQRPLYAPQPQMPSRMAPQQPMPEQSASEAAHPAFDPKFEKQMVDYHGKEAPGTIVIDTSSKFLYLVQGGGQALRYGVGVGKDGFLWHGVKTITAKREWPDWTPPAEMLQRRPDLPRHMEGGPQNPLGARAMYLGSSLYRIHGSNEPWTIGTNVSSGCIRMRNQDVIDLYGRVHVGARVVVI
jgi:lipoprotein-anchoring transpeptidase ErfK/SrfK